MLLSVRRSGSGMAAEKSGPDVMGLSLLVGGLRGHSPAPWAAVFDVKTGATWAPACKSQLLEARLEVDETERMPARTGPESGFEESPPHEPGQSPDEALNSSQAGQASRLFAEMEQ